MSVTEKVLKQIKPSPIEEDKVTSFVRELMRIGKTISGLDVVVVGSTGKMTWLKGDHDIDLFILFPKETSRTELEQKGLAYGKAIVAEMKGKAIVKYAEHPYTHATINGFAVDIVPCYAIGKDDKIMSAVDRSPLHLEFVSEYLQEQQRDEVRLLKQFCKGIGVYGSDAKTLGFSGYLCELLIIKHATFENVLKNAATWIPPVVIAIGELQNFSLKEKFPNQPLVFIDPVDKDRNVAANIGSENFMKFVVSCQKYIAAPSDAFFTRQKPRPLSPKEIVTLKNRKTQFVVLAMKKPDVVDDILYPQARKALRRICTLLKENDFTMLRRYVFADEKSIVFFFEFFSWNLPSVREMEGPPIFSRKHSSEFIEKHKGFPLRIEDTTWVAERERTIVTATDFLKSVVKTKNLESLGFPENIAKSIAKAQVIDAVWPFISKNNSFSAFLEEKYFEPLV